MSSQESQLKYDHKTDKQRLNERLETIGWALFLIMIGGIGLVPKEQVNGGVWLVGVGLIMLGLNVARYMNGIKTSSGTIVLGALALISGIGNLLGLDLPVLAILLILIGANLLLRQLFQDRLA